jgi:ATP-dependent DNA helicase RecG
MTDPKPINDDNLALLEELIDGWENEVVEFKEAGKDYDTDRIGRYVCALSNEANLGGAPAGWLVFGVRNKTRSVVGTDYRSDPARLNGIKEQVADGTEPSLALRSIRVVDHPDGRVVLFEVPPAPQGLPISWKGHYYARAGESLKPLTIDKLDAIRREDTAMDWTAQPVPDAEISDLSPEAMRVARDAFAQRSSARIPREEVETWTDEQFLRHVGLLTRRGLNRAAVLLLGRPESAWLLSPLMAELTWRLVGQEEAYEHFTIPFVLATTALYSRIRNIKIQLLPPDELVRREVEKYDQKSVLEAMHNCIAHQDYAQASRVSVTEYPDRLEFVSVGSFYEGEPDDYAVEGHMPRRYRNPALVQAMTQLNMIDHLGYGIERMNRSQASRYLPLPDYDLSNPNEVRLTIYGSVVDESYTRALMAHSDLPFEDVLALDRVQKGRPVSDAVLRRLRRKGLVEGRRPRLRVAVSVAEATSTKAAYVEKRGKSEEYCMALVTDLIGQHGPATRAEINEAVYPALSADLTDEQRYDKVGNLLRKMRKGGALSFDRSSSRWCLA